MNEFDGAAGNSELARIEDAGINASAPREQLWIDGWLVRFSPGKAKRARCIQAVAAGRSSLEAKLDRCLPVYTQAGLQPYVRITPFSQPARLDFELAQLGWETVDDTRVMVLERDGRATAIADSVTAAATRDRPPNDVSVRPASHGAFCAWVGTARRSSEREIRAHVERVAASPVPYRPWLAFTIDGKVVAGGQLVREGDVAGLYDVYTVESQRGRGRAEAVCRALLEQAIAEGARIAYLQVDAGNEAARRIYRRLGFVDAYAYHYRTPPAAQSGD